MNIAVVGLGYVGLVSAAGFAARGHRVRGFDADPLRIGALDSGILPFHEPQLDTLVGTARERGTLTFVADPDAGIADADVVVIAVGTHGPDGRWQTRTIERALSEIVPRMADGAVLVVRSTLPPDYVGVMGDEVRHLRSTAGRGPVAIIVNPEFTREGTAVADFLHPERIVIGVVDDPAGEGVRGVRELYREFSAPVLEMSGADASLAKLGSNLFLATKISFANELARLCDRYGARVDRVVEAMALDARIGGGFLRPGVGFGGSCLPHQVAMTARTLAEEGDHLPLLDAVDAVNRGQRDRCVAAVQGLVGDLNGRRIALLGLAFKPGTDDIRDAPSIPIATRLAELGASVVAFDPMPQARARAAEVLPGVEVAESTFDALVGADAAVLVTEWPEFIDLDWTTVASVMAHARIVDGRNALDESLVASAAFTYVGFGRGITRAAGRPDVSAGPLTRTHAEPGRPPRVRAGRPAAATEDAPATDRAAPLRTGHGPTGEAGLAGDWHGG